MKYIATKKILYGSLLGVMLVLSACVNTLELAVPYGEQSISHQSAVANAREFFNTHFGSSTRSEEQQPTPEAPYVVGDLVPDWESGVTVANEEKCYTDFAMQKDYRYFLLLGEEESEQMQAVELYSRFVSVEDIANGITSQYVVTYIPDEEYLNSYGAVAQDYGINCADNYEFSGVVLYTLPHGHHVAAYRYEEGELVAGSFLYDTAQTTEQNIADFVTIMEGLKVGIGEIQEVGTKAIITIPDIIWLDPETNKMYVYKYIGPPIHTPIVDLTTEYGFNITNPLIGDDHTAIGGGGGGTTTTEEEKLTSEKFADKILKNSLSPTDSVQLHTMLTEILSDCMGQTLLQEIYDNGVQISIAFNFTNSTSQFLYYGNIQDCRIVLSNSHSEGLLHELFHFIQYNAMGYDACQSAYVNIEVEAHLASLMYMSHTTNTSAHGRYDKYCSTTWGGYQKDCTLYLNADGSIPQGEFWEEMFRSSYDDAAWYYKRTHQNRNYDTNRNCEDNISNLSKLFENCD